MFWVSNLEIQILGIIQYFAEKSDSTMIMQIYVAWSMLLCSYLLAKVIIKYSHDNPGR